MCDKVIIDDIELNTVKELETYCKLSADKFSEPFYNPGISPVKKDGCLCQINIPGYLTKAKIKFKRQGFDCVIIGEKMK